MASFNYGESRHHLEWLSFSLWLLQLRSCLLIIFLVWTQEMYITKVCSLCLQHAEHVHQLFIRWPFAKHIRDYSTQLFGPTGLGLKGDRSIRKLAVRISKSAWILTMEAHSMVDACWSTWLERNDYIFHNKVMSVGVAIKAQQIISWVTWLH